MPHEHEYLWTLNFGPQHPATHTTLRLVLTLDGEKVVDAVPHIGYLHSGFEKLGEHLDFNQYVTIVDRMNYISPLANEIAWHHAVEKLLGIELTPRCKYLRTILAELMRLHDHLLNVGATALDLGAFTAFLYAFQQREKIYDIVEYASGQRFHSQLHARRRRAVRREQRLGRQGARVRRRASRRCTPRSHKLLTRNRIFIDRTKGIGVLTTEDAINFSVTGPDRPGQRRGPRPAQGRAVPGLRRLRLQGRSARKGGDCYARYLVRMQEMLESVKIIEQAIENIPGRAGERRRRRATWCCRPSRRCTAASRG